MFYVVASDTLKICLAWPIAFVLVVTFGAFDARAGGIDHGEDQSNTWAAIFHKRFDVAQPAPKHRFIKPSLGRLTVWQVDAPLILLWPACPRHVTQPQILGRDCFASSPNRLVNHLIGYSVSNASSESPIPGVGHGDQSLGLCPTDLDIEPAKIKENDRDAIGDREKHGLEKANCKEHGDKDQDLAKVSFTVTNTGNCTELKIAELYVGEKTPPVPRPIKELKGFQKVLLQPGESRKVTLELDQRSFAYFNTTKELWDAVPDSYNILVGGSSQNLPLKGQFKLKAELTSKP